MALFRSKFKNTLVYLVITSAVFLLFFWGQFFIKPDLPPASLIIWPARVDFSANESPEFNIDFLQFNGGKISSVVLAQSTDFKNLIVKVFDADGKIVNLKPQITNKLGKVTVTLPQSVSFQPGKYTLKAIFLKDNQLFTAKQDFSWGVLALNSDKSVYRPGEKVAIEMAILDDWGKMVCDAEVILKIIAPDGEITILATADGTITVSPQCNFYGVTKEPDYYAQYIVNKVGDYQLQLTAKTANGSRFIYDKFIVKEAVDFDIQREGPTRIYPPEKYQMKFKITAYQNYFGPIIEQVPAAFKITPQTGLAVVSKGAFKELKWQKQLIKGKTYHLFYEFKAPNITPEFYLLGPLKIGDWQEKRFWQIAVDKILVSVTMSTSPTNGNMTLGVGNTFTMTCDPACSGAGANPDVVDNYQYTTTAGCGSGNADIPTTGAVLTAATNPETASNCGSTSETITAAADGTVYISCYSTEGARTARSSQCYTVTVNPAPPSVDQEHYRWNNDNGNEAAATGDTEDTATTTAIIDQLMRLRAMAYNSGTGSASNYTYRLQYSSDAGGDCSAGSWTEVGTAGSCGATLFCANASQLSDGSATTDAAATSLTNPGSTTFVAGLQEETSSDLNSTVTLASAQITENEWSFLATSYATASTTYYLRMATTTAALHTYSVCPTIEIGKSKTNQAHYRWRNDDNNEADASWGGNQDTATSSIAINKIMRLRLEVANEGMASTTDRFRLQYSSDAAGVCSSGSWTDVPSVANCGSEPFCLANSQLTDQAATTNVASGLTDEGDAFIAGQQLENATSTTDHISLFRKYFTEIEYSFQVTSNATAGSDYYFRLVGDSANLDNYDVCSQLTVSVTGTGTIDSLTTNKSVYATSTENIDIAGDYTASGGNITNSTIDYVIFIDNNLDGDPDSDETYITNNCAGSAVFSWGSYTNQTTSFNVNDGQTVADSWECSDTNFPENGNYTLLARWVDSGGDGLATSTLTFDDCNQPTGTNNWWWTNYENRRILQFRNQDQNEALFDFPVLLVASTTNFDFNALESFHEMRFIDDDGDTVLNHEVEYWATNTEAIIWLKVPKVATSTQCDYVSFYYDYTNATNTATTTGVWNDNFKGVWHLSETASSTDSIKDSTKSYSHGTPLSPTSDSNGSIDGAWSFDGGDDSIETLNESNFDFEYNQEFSVCAWINLAQDQASGGAIVGKFDSVSPYPGWEINTRDYGDGGGNGLGIYFSNIWGSYDIYVNVYNALTVGNWSYICFTYNGNGQASGMRLYKDGISQDQAVVWDRLNNQSILTDEYVSIGSRERTYGFPGSIDEVRVANTEWSADWVAADASSTERVYVNWGDEATTTVYILGITASSTALLENIYFSMQNTSSTATTVPAVTITGTSAGWDLTVGCNPASSCLWRGETEMDRINLNGDSDNSYKPEKGKMCFDITGTAALSAESGSTDGMTLSTDDCFRNTTDVTVLTANSGYGQGTYWVTDMTMQQLIPGGSSSTSYTTTLTFTIAYNDQPAVDEEPSDSGFNNFLFFATLGSGIWFKRKRLVNTM